MIARLDLDLRHATLVHAPRTEFEKVATQECFREEVRHVVLSADEFDTDLAALDVVTMFEESNVEVLVLTRRSQKPEVFGLFEVKMLPRLPP